jgi:hypothetical protein
MPEPDLSRAAWRKSSYSNGSGGSCVEITALSSGDEPIIAIRDSKDTQGPVLVFGRAEWREFAAGVKAGQFDLS